MDSQLPEPLTGETLKAAQEALLKAENWRRAPEPWRGVFQSCHENAAGQAARSYMAIFDPKFSRELEAAGGRDTEAGNGVFLRADQEWGRLTGLPVLSNSVAWYDAAVVAGNRPAEADKITLEDAENAVRAWAVGP